MIVTGQSAEALTQPVLFPTRYACILEIYRERANQSQVKVSETSKLKSKLKSCSLSLANKLTKLET